MVWNYLFAGEDERSFDSELLQHIREKNNEQVESTLQNAKNLCTAIDSSGASLLHYSAGCGNEVITQVLIKLGANVNLRDEKGQTPLMLATKGEHEETIRVLIENDADIYISDKKGVSSLQLAIEETLILPSIIDMFLALMKINCSSFEIGRRLLKVDCPLYIAVRLRDLDVVKHMLSENSPIDAADPKSNQTSLHFAVQNGDVEMVKLLVDRGVNVNALDMQKQTPLSLIRTFEQTEILEILVNKGTKLTACTEDGLMQMYWVLTSGTRAAVKVLLKSGIDFQAKDSHDQTVMHYLAKNTNEGVIEIVKDWIDADDESKTIYDRIKFCLTHHSKRIIPETALSKSIDWNARDENDRTPLLNAMAVGNANFVEYLIKKRADLNVKTIKGITPFFETLESEITLEKRVKCVKLIMENGAYSDVDIERYLEIYNSKSAINRDFILLEPVIAHLILRQAKGERISEKLLESINCHSKLKDYVVACREELNHMKTLKIYGDFTLFDFLTESNKKFLFYGETAYENIHDVVKEHNFDSYYSCLLQQRFSILANDLRGLSMSPIRIGILIALLIIAFTSSKLAAVFYSVEAAPDSGEEDSESISKAKHEADILTIVIKLMVMSLVCEFCRRVYFPMLETFITPFAQPSKKSNTSTP